MKTKTKSKPTVIENMNIRSVTVTKDNNYYACEPTRSGWKCGKCLFGLINPYATKDKDDSCLRCGAKLHETITGSNYFNMESYQP